MPERWENILEDGLMQIAAHVLKVPELIEFLDKTAPQMLEPGYADLTKPDPIWLGDARDLVRTSKADHKLIVTLLRDGLSIAEQLPVLEDYGMEVEVCTPTYSRLWGWDGPSNPTIEGSLRQDLGTCG